MLNLSPAQNISKSLKFSSHKYDIFIWSDNQKDDFKKVVLEQTVFDKFLFIGFINSLLRDSKGFSEDLITMVKSQIVSRFMLKMLHNN